MKSGRKTKLVESHHRTLLALVRYRTVPSTSSPPTEPWQEQSYDPYVRTYRTKVQLIYVQYSNDTII